MQGGDFVNCIDYKFGSFVDGVGGGVDACVELLEDEQGFLMCRPCVVVSYLVEVYEGSGNGKDAGRGIARFRDGGCG